MSTGRAGRSLLPCGTVPAATPGQRDDRAERVGTILFGLCTPLLLGSWWALIPGGLIAILFVIRTALEDRTLRDELPGYADYAERVRYRLLPGVW